MLRKAMSRPHGNLAPPAFLIKTGGVAVVDG